MKKMKEKHDLEVGELTSQIESTTKSKEALEAAAQQANEAAIEQQASLQHKQQEIDELKQMTLSLQNEIKAH